MKNFNDIMKQAKKLQDDMAEVQKKLVEINIEGQSGAGLVKIVINGKGEVKSLHIDITLLKAEEKEILEDLVIAAFHDAKNKSEQRTQDEMQKITGGIPPEMLKGMF